MSVKTVVGSNPTPTTISIERSMEFTEISVAIIEWEPEEGNYTSETSFFVCSVCRATVDNPEVHEDWHKRLEAYGIAL